MRASLAAAHIWAYGLFSRSQNGLRVPVKGIYASTAASERASSKCAEEKAFASMPVEIVFQHSSISAKKRKRRGDRHEFASTTYKAPAMDEPRP